MKKLFRPVAFSSVWMVVLLVVIVFGVAGVLYLQKQEVAPEPEEVVAEPEPESKPEPVATKAVLAKQLIKADDIVLEKVEVDPQIPAYDLPLKTDDISNYEEFAEKIKLSEEALSLLEKNGFVVVPTPAGISETPDDFAAFYSALQRRELPIFITTDSLLHYYHIFFDTTLMKMERDLFYDDIWAMSKTLLDQSVEQYNESSGDLKEAARRNVAYLSVALELLRPAKNQVVSDETLRDEYCEDWMDERDCEAMVLGVTESYGEKASLKYFSNEELEKYSFEVPDFASDLVVEEIKLIEEHKGWEYSPIFVYKEDYSQYVPRGHYTKTEKLKNYFRAMMWYGRMTALIKGSPNLPEGKSECTGPMDGIVSEYDAKIQTLQAGSLSLDFSESEEVRSRWARLYAITGFFVGFSDDLGPYEYIRVLEEVLGAQATSAKIDTQYEEVKSALLDLSYNPKIYGGLGACELMMPFPPLSQEDIEELKVQAKKLLSETKGFRFMGQRFTLDSYLFSEIVSPYSGEYTGPEDHPFTWVKTEMKREVRGFPRGLDIMALFGSKRAKSVLEELGDTAYSDFEIKFSELKGQMDGLSNEVWFKNLYLSWLYVLKSLLYEFGEGYQTFMQTEAWQDKELATALASWAELRHDTILYVKQSYTMAELGGGGDVVKIVGYVEPVPEFYARLLSLTNMTKSGLEKLLPEEELEELQVGYSLDEFSEILTRLLEISKKELKNESLTDDEYFFIKSFGSSSENLIDIISGGDVDPDILKSVMVADVHTDGNTKQVLEEGVGYIKTLVAAYKLPEGHILVGVGPVFSYYEFKQPMEDRLTDEAWRERLDTQSPDEPEWVSSFSE